MREKLVKLLETLFTNNRNWATEIEQQKPGFFQELAKQQTPRYLWIGCSDSRVTANEIVGLLPGELFVHRNVANLVVHTDMSCLSVLQYAIDVLKVKHVIVCGHYGCGGVRAALEETSNGLIDNWLRNISDIAVRHRKQLKSISDFGEKLDCLTELNIAEQAINVGSTTILQDAWKRGQDVAIHGWIYSLSDGLLRNLDVSAMSREEWVELRKRFTTLTD